MITATRRLQFCAGHRVFKHESKCANLHGHNYVLEFTAEAEPTFREVDSLGRVLDFSIMKKLLGDWIEENWDHGFIYFRDDREIRNLYEGDPEFIGDWGPGALSDLKHFRLPFNPTAENMAGYLLREICPMLFSQTCVKIVKIVLPTAVKIAEKEQALAVVNQ